MEAGLLLGVFGGIVCFWDGLSCAVFGFRTSVTRKTAWNMFPRLFFVSFFFASLSRLLRKHGLLTLALLLFLEQESEREDAENEGREDEEDVTE